MGKNKQSTAGHAQSKKAERRRNILYFVLFILMVAGIAVSALMVHRKVQEKEQGIHSGGENVSMTVFGEMSEEALLERMKTSVVRIEAEAADPVNGTSMVGSGVILAVTKDYIDIATARHVVEETARPLVYFYDGSLAYGSVWAYGKQNDVAFVRVEAAEMTQGIGENVQPVKCADNDFYNALQPETEVTLVGSLTKSADTVLAGAIKETGLYIALFRNEMLICDVPVTDGMSGGGTFSKDGRLVGIIVGTDDVDTVNVAVTDMMAEYRSISQ